MQSNLTSPEFGAGLGTFVLVPGLGNSPPPQGFVRTLTGAGFWVAVTAYDDADPGETSIQALAAQVIALIRDIQAITGVALPVIGVGYSMGGFIIQEVLYQQPGLLTGAVLISTTCADEGAFHVGLPVQLASLVGHSKTRALLNERNDAWHRRLHACIRFLAEEPGCSRLRAAAARTQRGLLLLHGGRDELFHVKNAVQFGKKTPNVAVGLFPRGTHSLLHADPERVAASILTWWGRGPGR